MPNIDQLIDVPLWDRAQWQGVAYFVWSDGTPPVIAFVFLDPEAGVAIFNGLRAQAHQLRIAFIEGEIPGADAGYTVHVTPKMPAAGDIPRAGYPMVTRIHRMTPAPGAPHLTKFKEAFAQHRRCVVTVARFAPGGGELELNDTVKIDNPTVVFRQVADISQNDIDSVAISVRHPRPQMH
jgi:hypothetical protein